MDTLGFGRESQSKFHIVNWLHRFTSPPDVLRRLSFSLQCLHFLIYHVFYLCLCLPPTSALHPTRRSAPGGQRFFNSLVHYYIPSAWISV